MLRLIAKPVAELIQQNLKNDLGAYISQHKRTPKLVVVLVGEDPASVIYTTKKAELAGKLGFLHETIKFPASTPASTVKAKVQALNADPSVDGILIQRPLPDSYPSDEALSWVDPGKDVDCFHPENVGRLALNLPGLRSCTPWGVMKLLEYYKIETQGKIACVIGRSAIVGKPMGTLLTHADATVIQCHSRTPQLAEISREADIVIAAAGKPKMVTPSFVKPGAVVIDVGVHRTAEGKLCGDVDFDAVSQVASALTPVPGGVGPMTLAMLMSNTLQAAQMK